MALVVVCIPWGWVLTATLAPCTLVPCAVAPPTLGICLVWVRTTIPLVPLGPLVLGWWISWVHLSDAPSSSSPDTAACGRHLEGK